MPMVMIKCPTTGKPISTGIGMDKSSFDNPTNQMSNSVRCPHCQQTHTWEKANAFLKRSKPFLDITKKQTLVVSRLAVNP